MALDEGVQKLFQGMFVGLMGTAACLAAYQGNHLIGKYTNNFMCAYDPAVEALRIEATGYFAAASIFAIGAVTTLIKHHYQNKE